MSDHTPDHDPYLWLEEVESDPALAWVSRQNEATLAALQDEAFEADRAALAAIYNAPTQLPLIGKRGPFLYNFWRDREHRRGIWRRTTLDSYRTEHPAWETVLDVDALAADENQDWVWQGCSTLPHAHARGLVRLSRGGADASVVREFDLSAKRFVEGGFALPEAKQSASWIDADTLFVSSSLLEGERTSSGYPRTVRRWRRGTPFELSPIVFECAATDMSVHAFHDHDLGYARDIYVRQIDFFHTEEFLDLGDGERRRIDVPSDASVNVHRDFLVVRLRTDWSPAGRTFAAGALLAIRLDAFLAGDRAVTTLFEPTERTSLESWHCTRNLIFLDVLDNVRSRVLKATPTAHGFEVAPVGGVPANATVSVGRYDEADGEEPDTVLVSASSFLTPPSLSLMRPGEAPALLKAAPSFFDAAGLEATQHEAVSVDGARIPYFQVAPRDLPHDGDTPTLITGYGGFDLSLTPSYLATTGKVWLEAGRAYVVANLRGGGEFGPKWHEAGRREGKRLAQDDLAAIARDLVRRGVTRPARLAAHGGSNGGLLVGNMLTRYPDLFGAIWCSVPLLDMLRYTKLLAGASWIAEYGDPDVPEDRAFLQTYSPYHLVEPGRHYPPVLFTTSRRDDRVHPGHARKMAAKMQDLGYDVLFYEPGEGGHGFADKEQMAFQTALGYAFVKRHIAGF